MGKSQYKISFGGLPIGIHEFEFQVQDKFFKGFENSEIEKADLEVKVILTKQNNTMKAEFLLEGTIGIECDRCLKAFDFPVQAEESLVIKFGEPSESNDEILVIREGETEFEVAQYIYEYALLSLPVRKVPCEVDAKLFKCDKVTLKELEKLSIEEHKKENNPLWEQLNKLKNKN